MSKSSIYSAKFRSLAGIFRDFAANARNGRAFSRADALSEIDALRDAGELVCTAVENGYFLELPHLVELVQWGRGKGNFPTALGPRAKSLVACPTNVFFELVGGTLVTVKNNGANGVEVTGDRHGGIFPAAHPEAFGATRFILAATTSTDEAEQSKLRTADQVANYQRQALVCETLADMVVQHSDRRQEAPPAKRLQIDPQANVAILDGTRFFIENTNAWSH